MRIQDLVELLAALPLGETKVLTRAEFQHVFGQVRGEGDQKQVAMGLGERAGCRVLFSDRDDEFVTFTKRQTRDAVQTARRGIVHQHS